jgi:hypothetical protein
MQSTFDQLVNSILNEDYNSDRHGEAAGNFAVVLRRDGKFVRTVKTFPSRKQASSYASKCNTNKKSGEDYSVQNN